MVSTPRIWKSGSIPTFSRLYDNIILGGDCHVMEVNIIWQEVDVSVHL